MNSFYNFPQKNQLEILFLCSWFNFEKKNWNSFANSIFIATLMSLWDRRPVDRSRADHVMLASAADMADRDPAWISFFFPKLNNELKNEISILLLFFGKMNSLNFHFFFRKFEKKILKNLHFYFTKKLKMVVKLFSIFNRNEKWKWTKIFISHF